MMADILLLAVISALAAILVPESKNDGMRKLVMFIAALAILCAVCDPIANAAERLKAVPEEISALLFPDVQNEAVSRDEAEAWVMRRGIANLEHGIAALLRSRFALGDAEITVNAACSRSTGGDVVIDSVYILISGAQCNTAAAERYIGDMLACPCRAECG